MFVFGVLDWEWLYCFGRLDLMCCVMGVGRGVDEDGGGNGIGILGFLIW